MSGFWMFEIYSHGSLIAVDRGKVCGRLFVACFPHTVLAIGSPLASVILKETVSYSGTKHPSEG